MLSLLTAVAALLVILRGVRRASIPLAIAGATLSLVFAGRMTQWSAIQQGTGQLRIQLWSQALALFQENLVFGVGHHRFVDHALHVAHNSFIQNFAELGFLGGCLFLGAFFAASMILLRSRSCGHRDDQPDRFDRLLPFLAAALAGYVAAMMTLSRSYVLTTYLMLALVTAYAVLQNSEHDAPILRFDSRFIKQVAAASAVLLACTYVFVRWTVQWT